MKFSRTLVSKFVFFATGVVAHATPTPIYKDADASIDDRVADLLSRMTIADKTAQLIQGDISN